MVSTTHTPTKKLISLLLPRSPATVSLLALDYHWLATQTALCLVTTSRIYPTDQNLHLAPAGMRLSQIPPVEKAPPVNPSLPGLCVSEGNILDDCASGAVSSLT